LFIKKFFKTYERKYYIYGVKGGRFLPLKIQRVFTKLFPNLFAKELYYLINMKKGLN
jgi:hypothetical protein